MEMTAACLINVADHGGKRRFGGLICNQSPERTDKDTDGSGNDIQESTTKFKSLISFDLYLGVGSRQYLYSATS